MGLALEYRPRTLADLTGQEQVSLVLETMLRRYDNDEISLPTALLFTGPRGTGKTSSARIVAAQLNCTMFYERERPCGSCPSCIDIGRGSALSVVEIDAATHGGVEDIRDLNQQSRLSHSGRHRVFIIDEVHAASPQAFSALLKQLEEPAPAVIYILVTTEAHMIPGTIKSRCLTMNFNALSDDAIIERLIHICRAEDIDYGTSVMPKIAKRSKGGMRDSIMMLEQLAITKSVTEKQFDALWPDTLEEFAQTFLNSSRTGQLEVGISSIRETFQTYRDVGLMSDAIVENLTSFAGNLREQGIASPSMAARLIEIAWELRVKSRVARPSDPILLEAMLMLYAKEYGSLSNSGEGVALTKVRVLDSMDAPDGMEDLDEILGG